MSFRIDRDSLGEIQVPIDSYYGPFTSRALKQYKVSGQRSHVNLVKAFAMIKRSAAMANMELSILDREIGQAIIHACDEILSGRYMEEFVIESINSGAGTAFNMNSNEVIANRALEILGKKKGETLFIEGHDGLWKFDLKKQGCEALSRE